MAQETGKDFLIDDSSIIRPGWIWTPEESSGINVDPKRIEEIVGKLLSGEPVQSSMSDETAPTDDEAIFPNTERPPHVAQGTLSDDRTL